MSNNIANSRKPFYNIQQFIVTARHSSVRTSADIPIPSYISDRRVLAGIMYGNLPYLRGISSLEPSYPERFYYLESTLCLEPLIQKIYIAPWIGYALHFKKEKVLEMLLASGCDVYQRMVLIEFKHFKDGSHNIHLQEFPCFVLLYQLLEGPQFYDIHHWLPLMWRRGVNLEHPIEVRSQTLSNDAILNNEAVCYRDIWEYLYVRLSRLPDSRQVDRIAALKMAARVIEDAINPPAPPAPPPPPPPLLVSSPPSPVRIQSQDNVVLPETAEPEPETLNPQEVPVSAPPESPAPARTETQEEPPTSPQPNTPSAPIEDDKEPVPPEESSQPEPTTNEKELIPEEPPTPNPSPPDLSEIPAEEEPPAAPAAPAEDPPEPPPPDE